jgi:integrase
MRARWCRRIYCQIAYMAAYMARLNLTAQRIASYECDPGKDQSFLWDAASPCLALRATKGGAKAFIFQAKLHGKDVRTTIGDPVSWRLPDARAEANRLKVLVDQGTDPREVAAEGRARAEAKAAEKVGRKLLARAAWDAYMKAPHSKWGDRHRTDHVNAAQEGGSQVKRGKGITRPGPLASILSLPLHDITSSAVASWLKREGAERETAAANALRKFRTFIAWCTTQTAYKAAVHADCCTAREVTDEAPAPKTKADDCLQREQLHLWFKHMREIGNPLFSVYLQGLLLTGARRGEWQTVQWADVDFAWSKLTIRDKVEGDRTIPLTPYVASLLESLPRTNQYVFGNPDAKDGYVIGVTKPHMQALERAGLPHVSLHGLRRSFTTLSEWVEVPTGVVAQIQGHKPSAIAEKHYTRRPIDLLRMHHERIEAWILQQAGVPFP